MSEREWQPIETAPEDGTPVLLFCPRPGVEPFQITGYWDLGSDEFGVKSAWRATTHDPIYPPSHWRPLPPPPTEKEQ